MKKVILDTDFILTCLKYKVDIIQQLKSTLNIQYKVYIIDKTMQELKNKPLEKLAKIFLKKIPKITTKGNKQVDYYLQKQKSAIVATQDKKLKEKLKKAKIPIITLRQKKYLKLF